MSLSVAKVLGLQLIEHESNSSGKSSVKYLVRTIRGILVLMK